MDHLPYGYPNHLRFRWAASFASRPWVWPVAKRYLRRLSDRRLHCDPDCDVPLNEFLGFSSERA